MLLPYFIQNPRFVFMYPQKHFFDIQDWGVCAYQQALQWQKILLKERQAGLIDNQLIFVEHPDVFTIGRRVEPSMIF